MSVDGDNSSIAGNDANEHQPAYIFTLSGHENGHEPPAKKRKTGRGKRTSTTTQIEQDESTIKFETLLDGAETPECVALRQELFVRYWGETEQKIQLILNEANEETLVKVTSFVEADRTAKSEGRLPAAFIATGPNIASQSLLFKQLSGRLRNDVNGPVVNLRSGDASNLKAVLKQIIRDATNQKSTDDDEELSVEQDGRKYLNYDLEILHSHVKAHGCQKVIVAFQDSEAFDPNLLADIIVLFNSWTDRVPFILLFGIATSVEIFHERLPRAASRCLYGAQFDVEQTSTILENVFRKVVASPKARIRLGPGLVSSLMERQHDHVQSVQAFTAALKYAYMCHFYANPLAIFCDHSESLKEIIKLLQPQHYSAIRMLPSFRRKIETLVNNSTPTAARDMLEDNRILQQSVTAAFRTRQSSWTRLFRSIHVLKIAANGLTSTIDLYLRALKGTLNDSDTAKGVLDSTKRMDPDAVLSFIDQLMNAIQTGCPDSDLDGWADLESKFVVEITDVREKVVAVIDESTETGKPIRSSYAVHSKGLRTTVIAQKVQLSYEKSKLSKEDVEFTELVDRLSAALKQYFTFEFPQSWFLNEAWLYDSLSPYKDVFAPRPRFAIERALSTPSDYLLSCDSSIGIPSAKPATAIVYQMYLESGSLVNISDIWEAFLSHVGGEDGEGLDERTALMLLYNGLADLKLLGMVKQSKKKTDHLAKSSWKGL